MDNPELEKGTMLYWAKIVPCCGEFNVLTVKAHSIREDYFTATDMNSSRTYLFGYNALDKTVFREQIDAELKCREAEEEYYSTHARIKYGIDKGDD